MPDGDDTPDIAEDLRVAGLKMSNAASQLD